MAMVVAKIDLSSLTLPERVVLGSAGLLVLNGMLPWWYRIATPSDRYSYNAGLRGWGTVAILAAMLALGGVLARAWAWPRPAPLLDGVAYSTLGFVAIAAILVQALTAPHEWIGLYVGAALAAVLFVAGVRRRKDRRRGWA